MNALQLNVKVGMSCLRSVTNKLSVFTLLLVIIGISGCASFKEMAISTMEKPNLEKQLNRISTGINIIRTNHDILYNMPLSVDSEWIDKIANDVDNETRNAIVRSLANDPYYATVEFTDKLAGDSTMQLYKAMSGSHITPTDIILFNRINILYETHPDVYYMPTSIDEYKEFRNVDLNQVEALSGNLYKNVDQAVISLIPVELQESIKVQTKTTTL
jgi:hypothetical protein